MENGNIGKEVKEFFLKHSRRQKLSSKSWTYIKERRDKSLAQYSRLFMIPVQSTTILSTSLM